MADQKLKILFFGDCMFGRNNTKFAANPFIHVTKILNNADIIIFNLETVISPKPIADKYKEPKTFNFQSKGIQLKNLTKIIKHKPIFVSVANNHSLDFGVRGYKETQKFLRNNHFLFPKYKNATYKDSICFINATDHCGCSNIDEWSKHIWVIDYNDIKSVLVKLKKLKKKK